MNREKLNFEIKNEIVKNWNISFHKPLNSPITKLLRLMRFNIKSGKSEYENAKQWNNEKGTRVHL